MQKSAEGWYCRQSAVTSTRGPSGSSNAVLVEDVEGVDVEGAAPAAGADHTAAGARAQAQPTTAHVAVRRRCLTSPLPLSPLFPFHCSLTTAWAERS